MIASPPLRRHLAELASLAWPVILARSGIMIMALVDTVMVGRYSTEELAYQGLGWAPATTLTIFGIGLLLGTTVSVAEAAGGGRPADCGAAWRRGILIALVIGGPTLVLAFQGEAFLRLTGQSPEMAAGAAPVLLVFGLNLPVTFLFFATSFFLEGLGRPRPGMLAMLAANLINAALNWLLISGNLGFPELGAVGAAWGTTIARTVSTIGLIAYVWWMPDRDLYAVRRRARGGWASWRMQRRLGYSAGIAIGAESLAFGAINLFAGQLGEVPMASFSIAFNLLSIGFMVALGIGAATAVRVGTAWGRRDWPNLALAGWVGIAASTAAMAAVGLGMVLGGTEILGIYSTDPAVIAVALPLVVLVAVALPADGGQAVMANALRGRGDTWVLMSLQSANYLCLMIPATYILAFPLGRGVEGLMEGVVLASVVSVTVLIVRFRLLARRDRNVR